MNRNIRIRSIRSAKVLLRRAAEQPVLTLEQEEELASCIREGDERVRQDLYDCNLYYVLSVVKNYLDKGRTQDELIELGNRGLVLAAKRFNPYRGYNFADFAIWFIRMVIRMSIEVEKDTCVGNFNKECNIQEIRRKLLAFMERYKRNNV